MIRSLWAESIERRFSVSSFWLFMSCFICDFCLELAKSIERRLEEDWTMGWFSLLVVEFLSVGLKWFFRVGAVGLVVGALADV